MHGQENAIEFAGEKGKLKNTIGGYVSVIYHSIRNGDVSRPRWRSSRQDFERKAGPFSNRILCPPFLQLYHALIDVAKDVQADATLPTARL